MTRLWTLTFTLFAAFALNAGIALQAQADGYGRINDAYETTGDATVAGDYAFGGWGDCQYERPWNPDLFYNYYTQPNCGANPAAMYVSPLPTPPLVGHTYHTYPPLMPHEFMYGHKRTYTSSNGFSQTKTRLNWNPRPLGMFHRGYLIPR